MVSHPQPASTDFRGVHSSGDKIPMEEGVVGVVLARYTRSGESSQEVHYVVVLRREAEER
jgi:hypothetical protein